MIEKKLPISNSPLLGFLRWPYTLSITMVHEKTLPWFINNFIQVRANKYFHERNTEFNFNFYRGGRFEFYNNPFINTTRLDVELIDRLNTDIIDFFVDCVKNDYYVVPFIDEYFIPDRRSYQKNSFPHHIFIYGYNQEKEIFYTTGFNKGIFGELELNYDDFKKSYNSILSLYSEGKYQKSTDNGNFLMKFNENHRYKFDLDALKLQLTEYLESRCSIDNLNYNNLDDVFGIDTYDYLVYYYELLINKANINRNGTIRNLHVLWEHKKLMVERITFLMREGHLINPEPLESYIKIEKMSLVLRNLSLKQSVTADINLFYKIISKIKEIRELEILTLRILTKSL